MITSILMLSMKCIKKFRCRWRPNTRVPHLTPPPLQKSETGLWPYFRHHHHQATAHRTDQSPQSLPRVDNLKSSIALSSSPVTQVVESINGIKEGRWKTTITFYKPLLREQALVGEYPRDFLGIALLEQPNKYYLIIRPLRIVLEANSTITMIMEKLQSYKQRVSLNFEVLSFSHSFLM